MHIVLHRVQFLWHCLLRHCPEDEVSHVCHTSMLPRNRAHQTQNATILGKKKMSALSASLVGRALSLHEPEALTRHDITGYSPVGSCAEGQVEITCQLVLSSSCTESCRRCCEYTRPLQKVVRASVGWRTRKACLPAAESRND